MSHSVVTFPSISEPMFPGKPSQDLADEEERESEWADVPDVEVDPSGNIAMMMIMMIVMISGITRCSGGSHSQHCNIYDDDKLLRFHFLLSEFSVFDNDWVTI